MAGTLANQGRRDIDQEGQCHVWLRSADDVNSEIDHVSKYLHNLNKSYKSMRNYGSLDEANKLLAEYNENLLTFCKTNRKKYMIDDKTSRMDKKLLEYETMIYQYQKRVDGLQRELTEAIKAKDVALNRLSEIQSRLLKMNNPEITDLSDENRPTVLGEKLKRVYEDEWTDAFEFLTEKREEKLTEEQAINILYSLLKKCHELSDEALRGQHVKLAQVVNDPTYLKAEECLNKSEYKTEECLNEPQSKSWKPMAKVAQKLDMTPQPVHQKNNNSKQPQFLQTMPPGTALKGKGELPQSNKNLGKSVHVNNQKQNLTSQATLGGSNTPETQKLPAPKMSSETSSTSRTPGEQGHGANSVAQIVHQFSGTQKDKQLAGAQTEKQLPGAQTVNRLTAAQTEKQLSVNKQAKTSPATQPPRDQMSSSPAKTSAAMTNTQAQKLAGSEKHEQLPDFYDARETADTTKPTTVDQKTNRKLEMQIQEFSKIVAIEVLANLKIHDILPAMKKPEEFPDDIFNNEFVVKYIEECFQLCWLMQVQCPPMLMDFDIKPGLPFDANLFEIYTNRGPKITMVVWPPVHLHKGGPLVSKGYADCAK